MRPNLHPSLVNGRFGDPAVYVEILHRPETILFDLGDLTPLSTRDLLRIGHVFVSHMHMDHFIGFDRLLRVNVGREKRIFMVGPKGFCEALGHKLKGYTWDLVDRIAADLVIDAIEIAAPGSIAATRFRLKSTFDPERTDPPPWRAGPVLAWPHFDLTVAILQHHGPSLGFAVQEPIHVNVWKSRLDERGFSTGQWLQGLKDAVRKNLPDDTPIDTPDGPAPLGALRELISVEPGQKVVYVTDVADTVSNRNAVQSLARGADILLIEASFAEADSALAEQRAHLTTRAAGEMARAAGVRRIEPFHFSPRYKDAEQSMLAEVEAAFAGRPVPEVR